MIIGVPKEIKNHEFRVGMIPTSVQELTAMGHKILVEKNASAGIGIHDAHYQQAGAEIVETPQEIFARADMIVKVKEPQASECNMLRPGQVLFTYLHLAPDPIQTQLLLKSGCIAIAYETVTDKFGRLPLLTPSSEVAGRMSIQAGAHCLEKASGGRGILLGGVPGVAPAKVVILGGGTSGVNALRVAIGMEASVTVIESSLPRLEELDKQFGASLQTIHSSAEMIEKYVTEADLVVGAVLVPGATAPKLVSRALVKKMQPGSVIVDISIDQGGCFETSRPTTHTQPTYIEEGVVHYCVTNMPGAVPRTSSFALNNATLPFIAALANKGYIQAMREDPHLANGLNIYAGKITYKAVAEAMNLPYVPTNEILA